MKGYFRLFIQQRKSHSNFSQILLINVLFLLSMNGSCTDPFYITLLTRQKIVPNVTHGHLQGDNTKRVEVETKRRESMRKRWRGNAHEKKEDSFVVLFLLPIFQFEGHTLIRWCCS